MSYELLVYMKILKLKNKKELINGRNTTTTINKFKKRKN
jgi:hypothetical protein